MTVQNVFILIATALSPALMAIIFHVVLKKIPKWNKVNFWLQQLIIGLFFALLAMCSFYFGVKYEPVTEVGVEIVGCYGSANASPMIAGLIFGWPAGIVSGFFAAIFRLVMYPFGAGDYLRAAECISVLLTGLLAALLRKSLFDNKKPKWGYGLIIGILVETVHMVLIFITGMAQRNVNFAYAVVRQCDIACACVVTAAILISLFAVALIEHENVRIGFKDNKIAAKVQRWMLTSFVIAILGASLLTYFTCSTNSSVETHETLLNAARDIVYELETSPWGSVNGWDIANEGEGGEKINELQPIAYTRRIRTNGFIVVIGDSSNYVENPQPGDKVSPFKVVPNAIYSISADLDQYRTKEVGKEVLATFYRKGKPFDYRDYMTEEIKMKTDLAIPNETKKRPDLLIHKATPLLQFALKDSGEKPYDYVGVFVHARVTGPYDPDDPNDDVVVTQEFDALAVLDMYEARMSMGLSLRIAIYIELLVFVAVYGVMYVFIKRAVISNIQKINSSLEKITEGDLTIKVNVRSNQEFASLSDDINHTVDTLKGYIEEAKKRMEQELVFAKTIQHGTLPYIFPTTNNYDLYAHMKTAKQVGGDFYDFFPLSNNRLFFLIADVSGKGVPAAMFMMRAETLIKSLVQTDELSLDKIMAMVNDELCTNNEAQMFVTCWCAILDINTGHVQFVNAGHNPPLIRKKGGSYEEKKVAKNFVLAGMENIPYRMEEFDLEPGDEILIYTDGVTEATDKNNRLYGMGRLLKLLNESKYNASRELIEIIEKELDEFQKDVDQADDITMLMIRYKP